MNRTTRFLSLILAVLLLFPWTAGAAGAEIISDIPIDSEEDPLLVAQLESQAIDYVTKYVNTAYLYETEDFVSGTLLDVPETVLTQSETAELTVNGTATAVTDLQANLQQFADVAEYYRYIRSAQGFDLQDFDLSISTLDVAVDDNYAEVSMFVYVTFFFEGLTESSACGDHYTVYFSKINGQWCIVDIYSEAIDVYGLTQDQFNCEDATEQFDALMLESSISSAESVTLNPETTIAPYATDATVSGNNRMTYNAANAAAYAFTYTTTSHNYYGASGDNTTFTNDFFIYISGANCMNFASQCVWAGLGGNDMQEAINWKNWPMDQSSSASTDSVWYATKNEATSTWCSCGSFYDYIVDHGDDTSENTLKATYCEIESNEGFSGISSPLTTLKGAVLLVHGSDGDFSHAVFVNNATGTDYSDVYICANNVMRKNVPISFEGTYYSGNPIRIISPKYFYIKKECTVHTYPTATTAPGGKGTKCLTCDYIDLRVTGQMTGPIPVGSTFTILGNANYTCYKMRICVQYEGNSGTWTEYYNTNSVSRTVTFNQTGLYYITIEGYDSDPSVDPNATARRHVFAIRVY